MSDHIESIAQLLREHPNLSFHEVATQLNISLEEVISSLNILEKEGVVLGYHACLKEEKNPTEHLVAFIELRVTPERESGFDRIARRLARFQEVESLYLMSGGYDFLVMVRGNSIHEVSFFVTNKLSTMGTIRSFSTRFRLKTYKEHGILHESQEEISRLSVTP